MKSIIIFNIFTLFDSESQHGSFLTCRALIRSVESQTESPVQVLKFGPGPAGHSPNQNLRTSDPINYT